MPHLIRFLVVSGLLFSSLSKAQTMGDCFLCSWPTKQASTAAEVRREQKGANRKLIELKHRLAGLFI